MIRDRRVSVVPLAVLAVLLTPAWATAAPPASPSTLDPADAAVGWLSGELVDGTHLQQSFDTDGNGEIDPDTEVFDDYGLTADAVLAFGAAGTAGDAAEAATDWLTEQVGAYAGADLGEVYAGAVAKLILVADTMDRDSTDFGGADLPAMLLERQSPDGRFSDLGAGDYSNGITQALSIIALSRVGPEVPSAAVDLLVETQCPGGGVPAELEAADAACVGDVDTTAIVFQAFDAAGRSEAAAAAIEFLAAEQGQDGAFTATGSDGGEPAPNANSTGVAAAALRLAGETQAGAAATSWLIQRQVGADSDDRARGAIAFDTSGFDAASAARATTQAVLGLAGPGLAALEAPVDDSAYGLGDPEQRTEDDSSSAGGGSSIPLLLGITVAVIVAMVIGALLWRARRRVPERSG